MRKALEKIAEFNWIGLMAATSMFFGKMAIDRLNDLFRN